MTDPFVVVGGDAAGLSAASKCARTDPDRDVVVFEKGRWVSFAHCGMPYYVKGEVDDLEGLLSLRPDDVADRGIDLRRGHEVVAVDPDAETVTVEGPDGRFDQPYGDLLVATGAHATEGPFAAGLDLDAAFTLHEMDAAAALRALLADPETFDPDAVDGPYVDRERVRANAALDPPASAAIVGGGYVGVEMAEAFAAHGLDVHLFQRGDHVLAPFGRGVGEAVAEEVEAGCREHGVAVHTNTAVGGLVDDGDGRVGAVETDAGRFDVGVAVVGIGVQPNTALLPDAVELGESGAVAVDEYGRTSVDGVYAAGDCAEATNAVTGEPDWVPLGLTANRGGRAVGATVAGEPTEVGEIAGTAVVKAFDLGAGRTGLVDEDRAREAGFDPVAVEVDGRSRSGYYPGAETTTVRLVGDRDSGRVLGGSTVARDRAAKRVDVVAMAVQDGITVGELERRDLGYAPPFSPVWDPVLVAAKVLGGKLA
jgi:NADPH-dependent 2,4-dienoyl-CoA reductase/sulfur reductase-like enzyme